MYMGPITCRYLDPNAIGFDVAVYAATRRWVLSEANPQFFRGAALRAVGSPHTPRNMAWPMAAIMAALTAESLQESRSYISHNYVSHNDIGYNCRKASSCSRVCLTPTRARASCTRPSMWSGQSGVRGHDHIGHNYIGP